MRAGANVVGGDGESTTIVEQNPEHGPTCRIRG